MNAQATIAQIKTWLFLAAELIALILIAATVAAKIGIRLPIPSIGFQEACYMAGAIWLLKK